MPSRHRIRTLEVWGRARSRGLLTILNLYEREGKKHSVFFETWMPDKGSNTRSPIFQAGSFNHCTRIVIFTDTVFRGDIICTYMHLNYEYASWTPANEAFNQCRFNVGLPSSTLAQHSNSIGWMPRICRTVTVVQRQSDVTVWPIIKWALIYWESLISIKPKIGFISSPTFPQLLLSNSSKCLLFKYVHLRVFVFVLRDQLIKAGYHSNIPSQFMCFQYFIYWPRGDTTVLV